MANFVALKQHSNIMRNNYFLKNVATLFAALCLIGSSFTFAYGMSAEGVQIVIRHRPGAQGNAPRGGEENPFYAELTELGVLLVTDSDWGDATVTLSSIEGDYYQTTFEMSEGSILLPINGDAGDSYTLTISLGSLGYEGSFVL